MKKPSQNNSKKLLPRSQVPKAESNRTWGAVNGGDGHELQANRQWSLSRGAGRSNGSPWPVCTSWKTVWRNGSWAARRGRRTPIRKCSASLRRDLKSRRSWWWLKSWPSNHVTTSWMLTYHWTSGWIFQVFKWLNYDIWTLTLMQGNSMYHKNCPGY